MAYVQVDIDASEFDDDELVDELESRGWSCSKDKAKTLSGISRVEHLVLCGFKADAISELIRAAEQEMGISLH